MEISELVSEIIDGVPTEETQRLKRVAELFQALEKSEAFHELEKLVWIMKDAVSDMVFARPDDVEYLKGVRIGIEVMLSITHANAARARAAAQAEVIQQAKAQEDPDIMATMVSGLGGEVSESF